MEEPGSYGGRRSMMNRGPASFSSSSRGNSNRPQPAAVQRHQTPHDLVPFLPDAADLLPATPNDNNHLAPIPLQPLPPASVTATTRRVKLGETLINRYDLTQVLKEDIPSVTAAILTVVTLEDSAPLLDIKIERRNGYYAMFIRKFNEFIDIFNMYDRLLGNPDPTANIIGGGFNPETFTMQLRLGMQGHGNPIIDTRRLNQPDRKRGRRDDSGCE